jgi:hypothetical protein
VILWSGCVIHEQLRYNQNHEINETSAATVWCFFIAAPEYVYQIIIIMVNLKSSYSGRQLGNQDLRPLPIYRMKGHWIARNKGSGTTGGKQGHFRII